VSTSCRYRYRVVLHCLSSVCHIDSRKRLSSPRLLKLPRATLNDREIYALTKDAMHFLARRDLQPLDCGSHKTRLDVPRRK
jgi:hypothetical protein